MSIKAKFFCLFLLGFNFYNSSVLAESLSLKGYGERLHVKIMDRYAIYSEFNKMPICSSPTLTEEDVLSLASHYIPPPGEWMNEKAWNLRVFQIDENCIWEVSTYASGSDFGLSINNFLYLPDMPKNILKQQDLICSREDITLLCKPKTL